MTFGNIELLNVDCLKYMATVPDKFFELAIVDPPYGIGINQMNMGSRSFKPTKKNWDNEVPSKEYFDELFRVSKDQIIWGGNYFDLPPSQYFAIWDKGETMYGRDFAECEYAWVSNGGTRIFKKNPNQLDRIHPTQKSVDLYKWLLTTYAECKYCDGDSNYYEDVTGDGGSRMLQSCDECGGKKARILDTHGGSMSISLACHDYGFPLTLCELDKDYYEAGVKRFKNHIAQQKLFV